jgi:tetratricopeptide (TPR) repeat protein
MTEKSIENTRPAESNHDGVASVEVMPVRPATNVSWLVWSMMGLLVLLALVVIFVLPKLVEEYELPFTPRANSQNEMPIVTPSNATQTLAVSPFDAAQKAKQRTEAQEVLAQLLNQQKELEKIGVEQWAADEYSAAYEAARLGDEAYRTQQFVEATVQYQSGLDAMKALLDSVPQVLNSMLQRGDDALTVGDANASLESYQLALLLSPDNADASVGMQRSLSLDKVRGLMRQAERAIENGLLTNARDYLQQAVALDQYDTDAQVQLTRVRLSISDREFTDFMSAGFLALSDARSAAAIAQFEKALAMRPGSKQALDAIRQTQDKLEVIAIEQHRAAAQALEAQEEWQQAVNEYDAALAVDANLVFATTGKDYAHKRVRLDSLLQDAIQRPIRLGDPAVFEQTVQVYYTGRQIEDAGPILTRRLDTLEVLLTQAQVPVDVQLISDNRTDVTVYQVGVLGQFTQQTVSLMPGEYVAVGTRPGYRDVRKEFVVGFDHTTPPINVVCEEAIATASRP